MARKQVQNAQKVNQETMHITGLSSSDFINTSSKEYAIYTAQNRAIPSVCDGLKDGQRKMLWMIRNKSEKIKTISLAGSAIQEGIFLHGDVSASDTISRLAAPYLNNVPLLDGVGAFGTRVSPDGWGAPRYTYVKKSKATQALLYTDLDIVPLKPNYDGSTYEPCNFLPLIPLVLLNGISGIAVGWSTDILPHSLQDIVEATVAAIDNKPIKKIIPKYDCMNVQTKDLGDNSYEFMGRVVVESVTTVRVTELPPDLSLERFKARLNQMEDDGLINTYTDRSTKTINIEIRFKRGTIDGWGEQDAINFLKLKNKASERFVVLDFNNTSIRQYENAQDLVKSFVEWRLGWFTIRFQKQIADLTKELNFACAVKACVDKGLPKFLPTAPNKSSVEDQVRKICTKITLDDSQIERLVSFPSYRWAQDSVAKVDQEIVDLGDQIVVLEDILNDPKKIKSVYKKEVQALLKL
jgi:DNA gyrase/topoisomerase IV subunit A